MFSKKQIKNIIKNTLTADSYSLGAHWVYDEKQLSDLDINWDELNAPQAMWHKGKNAGDFTHIGDQAYWLYEFLKDKDSFVPHVYMSFWKDKMSKYDGYIDGATRETLENIENGIIMGSDSHDFSVIGRISSLLLISSDESEFRKNVQEFVKLSHNNKTVLETADFFASLLFKIQNDKDIKNEIVKLSNSYSDFIKNSVKEGVNSSELDTFQTIRNFGPACDIQSGFRGIIHLLCKYPNDLKKLLIQNAKAGGDSSSRAMSAIMILSANKEEQSLPKNWTEGTNKTT
jgi:ADP-ribosylglycohydrolase